MTRADALRNNGPFELSRELAEGAAWNAPLSSYLQFVWPPQKSASLLEAEGSQ